jgi:hypothetical protein
LSVDNVIDPMHIVLQSTVEAKFINSTFKNIEFDIELRDKKIIRIGITQKGLKKNFICV